MILTPIANVCALNVLFQKKKFKLDKMVNTVYTTQLILFYLFPNSNRIISFENRRIFCKTVTIHCFLNWFTNLF